MQTIDGKYDLRVKGSATDRSTFKGVVKSYRTSIATLPEGDLPPGVINDLSAATWRSKGHLWDLFYFINVMDNRLRRTARVLDFGCGFGFFSALLAHDGFQAFGLDIATDTHPQVSNKEGSMPLYHNREYLPQIWNAISEKDDVDFAFYDSRTIPYPDDYFGGVVANGVLEHIPPNELGSILSEIRRVLTPGGKFFVFHAPRRRSYAEHLARLLGIGHHDVLFEDKEFAELLTGQGFIINYIGVHDMIIRDGHSLQWLVNLVEPVTRTLEKLLLKTPLRVFAHHIECYCEKPREVPD